jgi:hypothetical protein
VNLALFIDACFPRDLATVISAHDHESVDVRDIGMRRADDPEIAEHAKQNGMALLTEDWGFADVRQYPPQDYQGIVVFETHDDSIDEKVAALKNLLDRPDIVAALPGRLAIVTATRIRLRPPL